MGYTAHSHDILQREEEIAMKFKWLIPAAALMLCLCACTPKTPDTELKDTAPSTIEVPDIDADYEALSSLFPAPAPKEAKSLADEAVKIAKALYLESRDGYTGNYVASYNGTQTTEDGTFYYFNLYDSYAEPEGSAEYADLCTIAVQLAPEAEDDSAPRYFLHQGYGYTEIRYDGKTAELIENTDGTEQDSTADGSAG